MKAPGAAVSPSPSPSRTSRGGTRSAQGWHGFAYATWQENNWFVDGIVGGNWFDNSYRRSNILGTQGTVLAGQGLTGSSSNDTGGFVTRLTAGHLYEFRDYALMPYAYASWLYQKTGGISETGADIFSLTGSSNTLDQVEGGIGARAQLGGLAWQASPSCPRWTRLRPPRRRRRLPHRT